MPDSVITFLAVIGGAELAAVAAVVFLLARAEIRRDR